eukprot:719370-Pyramimonas_sp.AAC.1
MSCDLANHVKVLMYDIGRADGEEHLGQVVRRRFPFPILLPRALGHSAVELEAQPNAAVPMKNSAHKISNAPKNVPQRVANIQMNKYQSVARNSN